MIVKWSDRALASDERQPETYQSARGDTRTKLPPRSREWSAACFLLLVTPYFDVTCTCVTSNMWNVTFSVRIRVCRTYCHLILYWTNICPHWQIKLPLHSFALLYSVELSARGKVLCALVMLQTQPDHHSHHYNVKTDITLALHNRCRIYMCSLNMISQILCTDAAR